MKRFRELAYALAFSGSEGEGKGVLLETPEEIRARAAMINQQVWVTRVMPPGNLTNMTDAERRMIARWFKGGAE